MDNTTQVADRGVAHSNVSTEEMPDESPGERLLDDELLVEEISIDGMCGVY